MREAADAERIGKLAKELGRVVPPGTRMYLTGGATAVLEGWRDSTVDIASPLDFLPALPGWQGRSRFRFREGNLEVFDFDLYSQALSKLERGFELDLEDVHNMVLANMSNPNGWASCSRRSRVSSTAFPQSTREAFAKRWNRWRGNRT